MGVISSLAIAEFRHHRVRTILTMFAVMLAVALIVAMTSGFYSMRGAARQFVVQYFGTTDVQVRSSQDARSELDKALLEQLLADPDVKDAAGVLKLIKPVLRRSGRPTNKVAWVIGMDPPGNKPGDAASVLNEGRWFNVGESGVIVIDQQLAEELKVEVGQNLKIAKPNGQPVPMKIIGLAAKPKVLVFRRYSIYAPIKDVQDIHDHPDAYSEISVDLNRNVDRKTFVARWQEKTMLLGQSIQFRTVDSLEESFDKNMQGLAIISYLGGMIAMLAAGFIVFSTVSMGLTERMRVLAMMRAIGASRYHVSKLVMFEALAIGIVGITLGVIIGWTGLSALIARYDNWFLAGAQFSIPGGLYAAIGMLIITIVAGLIPAIGASRVDPLAAMTPLAKPASTKLVPICFIIGLVLVFTNTLILQLDFIPRTWKINFNVSLGLPFMMIGLFLISPFLIKILDRIFGTLIASCLRIDRFLIKQQLDSGLWRSAGTVSALMVGLLISVILQMHGRGVLNTWQMPDRFPDMLVYAPLGLNAQQQLDLEAISDFKSGQVLPIAWASPELGGEIDMFKIGQLLTMPKATILLGMDIDRAFGLYTKNDDAMVQLDFLEGNPDEAAKLLKQGRHVLISAEFNKVGKLTVGDNFPVKTARFGVVNYKVAGVIRAAGVDMIVRVFNVGSEMQRWTAGSAITSIENLKQDFGIERVRLFAANIKGDIQKEEVERAVRKKLRIFGLLASDARKIKAGINTFFTNMIGLLSAITMLTTIVASLGVVNTIMAGIRSRQWQLGILRSIGLTRSQLIRVIVAEAVMLGVIAGLLGIMGGVISSHNADMVSAILVGVEPVKIYPVDTILIGLAITIAVAVFAALYPAWQVTRKDILQLLSASRAAT